MEVLDPFSAIRNQPNPFLEPDGEESDISEDTSQHEQPNEPEDFVFSEHHARCLYESYIKPKDVFTALEGGEKADSVKEGWADVLVHCLASDAVFQRAVLDDSHAPGLIDFAGLRFNHEWFIAVYLPGFYEVCQYEGLDASHYLAALDMQQIVQRAKRKIDEVLETIVQDRMRDTVGAAHSSMPPQGVLAAPMATLFELAQEEKRTDHTRGDVRRVLNSLPSYLQSDSGQALCAMYGIGGYQQQNAVAASSSNLALFSLAEMDADNDLSAAVMDATMLAQSGDFDEDIQEDTETSNANDPLEAVTRSTAMGAPIIQNDFEVLPAESIIRDTIAANHADMIYPQSNQQLEENIAEMSTSGSAASKPRVSRVHRTTTRFLEARQVSLKEWKQAEKGLDPKPEVLKQALEDFGKTIQSRLSAIDNTGNIGEKIAQQVKPFTTATARPAEAAKAKTDSYKIRGFTSTQAQDNWWHVRKYFQAFGYVLEKCGIDNELGGFEYQLAVIFAGLRGALDDPLPLVMLVDYVLGEMLKHPRRSPNLPSSIATVLFDELTIFAYGTAVNCVIMRFPTQNSNAEYIKSKWYPKLVEWNPLCADIDCNRALPSAQSIKPAEVRALPPVGTRNARIGRKSFRSIISDNRDFAFSCLYDIVAGWKADEILVILINWYSHIFHSVVCKSRRGKLAITAF
ncbi:hypothetical protein CBER1_01530 [Cercospora berteroae]|uniref:Uncharacterized protein n=1 Tax=Cercospora berteroae TaxID=357750 RepID=A0A2S6C5W7_9PEZI|nr:hypothetical protein CBER1_01530 [Cercospora berteroae]